MTAGLAAATGDAVVILDADLQDPPECLPAMVDAWLSGHDVVTMRRVDRRSDSWWKRRSAAMFYRALGALSDTPVPADVGDFRLMSRRVVDVVTSLPERTRYMKGLFAWVGFPTITLDYVRPVRHAGTSAWSTVRLVGLAVDGITSFSIVPLRIATVVGGLAALLALGFGGFTIIRVLLFGDEVAGFPTLVAIISFLGGLQLLATGVLGEYVGRTYLESKRRPLYVVESHRSAGKRAVRSSNASSRHVEPGDTSSRHVETT